MKSDRMSEKGGRRVGIERREFSFTAYAPERRSGKERRDYDDRRQEPRILTCLEKNKDDLNENASTWDNLIPPQNTYLFLWEAFLPSTYCFNPALYKAFPKRSITAWSLKGNFCFACFKEKSGFAFNNFTVSIRALSSSPVSAKLAVK